MICISGRTRAGWLTKESIESTVQCIIRHGLVQTAHMGSVVRQIQRRDSVGKLLGALKGLNPLLNRHTITRDAVVNQGKSESARYIGIGIDQLNTLTKRSKPFYNGVVS